MPSVEIRLKILFFIFCLLFLLGLFFNFKFCEVLFESFRIFGKLGGLTFFVSFVFFVTESVCKFGHVTFFVRN